jgi:lipopolysaccharide export LptBFGC system permease protein LptF
MSLLEMTMLICFGAAWPLSIYKSYTSKSTAGKSVIFLIIIMIGYVAGILNKLLYNYDFVIYLYILNLIMVFIDTMLYFRNSKAVKKQ